MNNSAKELLVVNDDASCRDFLLDSLVSAGYSVKLATDCGEAWKILENKKHHFSAILLDRTMQRQGGIVLLERIKANRLFADIPVIFLTDIDDPLDIASGIKAGAFYYLVKPLKKDVLLAIVQSSVNSFRMLDNLRYVINPQASLHNMLMRCEFRLCTLMEAHTLAYTLCSFYMQPKRAFLGISELLVNAVEHGNLGIGYKEKSKLLREGGWEAEIERRLALPENSGKKVEVQLERSAHEIRLTISDCGAGFDCSMFLEMSPERAFDLNGRGIAMSRMISFDSLEYIGKGNRLLALVNI